VDSDAERVTVTDVGAGIKNIEATIGFMERPDIGNMLALAAPLGARVDR